MAGAGGIEPPNGGIKIRWLSPYMSEPYLRYDIDLVRFSWLVAKFNRLFDVMRFSKNFQAFSTSIIDCRLLHATWSRHEPARHTKP
jgi:hypothetical protein